MLNIRVAKLGTVVELDETKLSAESLRYLLVYGATQAINDAHSSVARKNFESDAAFLAAVEERTGKRIAQIESGDVPGTRAPADSKAAVARKLAKEYSEEEMTEMAEYITRKRAKAAKAA